MINHRSPFLFNCTHKHSRLLCHQPGRRYHCDIYSS